MTDPINLAVDQMEGFPHQAPAWETNRLSVRFVVALVLLNVGVYLAAVGMSLVAWPLTVAMLAPSEKVLWLSVVTGAYALVNVIATPIAGAMSDRCTSRFGMRRPFITVGVVFAAAGLLIMAASNGIGQLIVGVIVMGIGNGTVSGASGALVPDQVPERLRGRIQGLLMVCIIVSGVLASIVLPMFIGNQMALFGVPAVVMLVAAVLVNVVLKDRKLSREERAHMDKPRNLLGEFKINPKHVPDYSWAWLGKFIVVFSTVLTSTYGVYLLTDQLKVSPADLPGIITITGLVGLATAIVGAVAGAWISDKLQKRKSLVLFTAVIMGAGAVVVAFSPSVTVYLVGLVLLGLGAGAYGPIDGALFIDVLPGGGAESGKYMSLMTVADQIPRSFGPILGSLIVALGAMTALGGYSVMYLLAAVIGIVGGLTVRKIKGSV